MVSMNPWMIGLVTAIAAMLLRSGFRRHGWARAGFIALTIVVLLGAFWYMTVQAGKRIQSQENASAVPSLPSIPAVPDPGSVRWHGNVTIPKSGGLNLDQVPPKPGRSPDVKLGTGPDQIQGATYGGHPNLAPWNSRRVGTPDSFACLLQLSVSPQLRMTVRPGSTVCLQTAAGGAATLTFTSVNGAHGADSAEATIWSEQEARR